MASPQPNESPRRRDDDNPLKGRSIRGIERVSFEGLRPESIEYAKAVVSLCLLVHARKVVVLDESARQAVRDLDIFEWSAPYPSDVRVRPVPYFPGDLISHRELARLEDQCERLRTAHAAGEPFKGTFLAEPIHHNTPTSYHVAMGQIDHAFDKILDGLRRRCNRGISVPEGKMRRTDFGELLVPLIYHKPIETSAQIVRMVLRAEEVGGKATRRPIVEHMIDLWDVADQTQPNRPTRLAAFNMHLRKLGVAMIEGSLSFDREYLANRAKCILCEGHVDTFLSDPQSRSQLSRHRQAYKWLQGWELGQHSTVPYASWNAKEAEVCFQESSKIVARNRHLSYHFFNRLRMESRSIGTELSLLREFAFDCFDDVRFIRCDNIDRPPGPGTIISGAKIDKLFHGLNPDRETLFEYRKDKSLWFADQLRNFEGAVFVPLRHWVGASAESPEFTLFGERYYFLFENHHFSSTYGYAYGIPASIVNDRLYAASYGLDQGPNSARDAADARLSIPELIISTLGAGKLPLTLGHMSPLFGGMCNALPTGSAPVFTWERDNQSVAWKDLYGHVHWPWLIHSFRDNQAKVDEAIKPLVKADREIRAFAIAGQQLIDAFRHRYSAWKNDLLPGEVQPPRMLVKAYDIYREHVAKGAAGKSDETIYIGAQERNNPIFNPFPLINCFTLQLTTRNHAFETTLPKRSLGAGKTENSIWNKHIAPLVRLKGRAGEWMEGPYELVIIGENDIKR